MAGGPALPLVRMNRPCMVTSSQRGNVVCGRPLIH